MDAISRSTSIVAYAIGLPLGVIGVLVMSSSPSALAVGAHVTALGLVLLLGFGFGGDAWLIRFPVALIFAVLLLAGGFYGISGVFPLAQLALALAVVVTVLWRLIFRTWLGYSLVFMVGCVIVIERVVAAGGGFWLSVLALIGWIVVASVPVVMYGMGLGGREGQAADGSQHRPPTG
jgi:hypothetical protein